MSKISHIMEGSSLNEKVKNLKKIKVDGKKWLVYYLDSETNEKWVKDYPESDYHGGGAPRLSLIDKFPWEEE